MSRGSRSATRTRASGNSRTAPASTGKIDGFLSRSSRSPMSLVHRLGDVAPVAVARGFDLLRRDLCQQRHACSEEPWMLAQQGHPDRAAPDGGFGRRGQLRMAAEHALEQAWCPSAGSPRERHGGAASPAAFRPSAGSPRPSAGSRVERSSRMRARHACLNCSRMRPLNFLRGDEGGIGLGAAILRVERMTQLVSGLASDVRRRLRHPDHGSRQAFAFLERSASARQPRREQHQTGMIRESANGLRPPLRWPPANG